MSGRKPMRLRILESMLVDAIEARRASHDERQRASLARRVRVLEHDIMKERGSF